MSGENTKAKADIMIKDGVTKKVRTEKNRFRT